MKFDHINELLPLRAFRALGGRLLSLEGGKGSSAPATPDYVGAANATAAGNKEAALTTGALNRPTQVNPYGSVTWELKPGADANNPKPGDWIQTQTLSDAQQQLLDKSNGLNLQLADLANKGVGQAGNVLGTQFDTSTLANSPGNLNYDPAAFEAARQQTADAQYAHATQYYDRNFTRQQEQLAQELANKGLTEGSQAYQNAMTDFNQRRDSAYADATNQAVAAGNAEQASLQQQLVNAFQTQQNARNNSLQEALTLRELPINEINALRTGTQVTNPTFSQFNPVSNYSGADILGATGQQYSAQSSANAANAAANAQNMNTWGNLAAAGLLAYYS